MSVDELIEARKALEQQIESAINGFSVTSGLAIQGIDVRAIDIRMTADSRPPFHYRVKVDVRL